MLKFYSHNRESIQFKNPALSPWSQIEKENSKMKCLTRAIPFGWILLLYFNHPCHAQTEQDTVTSVRKLAPKVFLDCNRCDFDHVRREITFVNYVRDRKDADLHILVTIQRTGSGGREYTLHFLGLEQYTGMNDTLIYASNQTETDDEIRDGLVRSLKLGLVRFVAKTPIADQLDISYDEEEIPEEVVDKWNYWVFTTRVGGFFEGEESTSLLNLNGSIRANRITDNWKIRSSARVNYREENFTTSEGDLKFINRDYDFSATVGCVYIIKLSFPLDTAKFQFNDVFGTLDLHVIRVADTLYKYILKHQ